MKLRRTLLIASLAFEITQSTVFAALGSIGVNFDKSASGDLAGSDFAGAPGFAQINWQNLSVNATNLTLSDSTGAATAATMTASGQFFAFSIGPLGADEILNNGSFSSNPTSNPTTITLSNIPYASYSIVVYALTNSSAGTRSTTVGGTTYFLLGPGSELQAGYVDGNSSTPYTFIQGTSTSSASPTPNADYVVFTNLAGSSQTITSANLSGGGGPVEGFQIVQTVPEPASALLVGFGIPILLSVCRRRRW